MQKEPGYIIISPMRNEEKTVETTIQSVLKQTRLPNSWYILDDGSTDNCPVIVKDYQKNFPWINLIELENRGNDLVGQGVAEVLNKGLDLVDDQKSDYLCKLDVDIDLPAHYFEELIDFMECNKDVAIASGHPFTFENGKKVIERHSSYFPSGTARLYRRSCLKEIGRFVESVGWDTVDILRMHLKGYQTIILSDLRMHHIRRMGTRKGYLDGMIRDGRNAYLTGYSTVFFIARALFNMQFKPYCIRTLCMIYGFFKTMISKQPRIVAQEELKYHQKLQWDRLLFKHLL